MAEKKFKFSFVINPELCAGCATCFTVCKFNAVAPDAESLSAYVIDQDACKRCSKCFTSCPVENCIEKVAEVL